VSLLRCPQNNYRCKSHPNSYPRQCNSALSRHLESVAFKVFGKVMPEASTSDILVAVGRLEEMMKAMNDKLDRLENTTDRHWKKLAEHDVEIELLKQRQGPRVHFSSWIAMVVGSLGFIAAFVTWVVK